MPAVIGSSRRQGHATEEPPPGMSESRSPGCARSTTASGWAHRGPAAELPAMAYQVETRWHGS